MSDLFELDSEQRTAFRALKSAFTRCKNVGLSFFNQYGTLMAYDSSKISHVDDDPNDGIPVTDAGNVYTFTLPCNEWADDGHYYHPVLKKNEVEHE